MPQQWNNPAALTDINNIKEATRGALQLADENNLKRIAIPGMGTGIGGVLKNKGASAILEVIVNFEPQSIEEIILMDISSEMVKEWNKIFKGDKD